MKSFFLPICLILLFVSLSLVLTPTVYVQNKPAPKIDLNGLWLDGSRDVKITQIGSSVVAKFVTPPMCDPQDKSAPRPRETDFVGNIQGNTIDGDASVCNFGKSWGAKIGIQSVKMVLAISADQNTLHGTYDGWKGKVPMTLTRKCKPDAGELCVGIGRAIQAMKGALTPTPSAAYYQNLQQDVGVELSQAKSNLCDNPEASAEVEALQQDLDSLKYVPGQSNTQNNLALSRIDSRLKQLAVSLCGRASQDIPPPLTCPQGTQAKTEADASMLNSFKEALEENISTALSGPFTLAKQTQTKKCLGEIFGQGCSRDAFINNLRNAAAQWSEGPPSTEVCNQACRALGDWYEASACSKGGLDKKAVIDKCTLTCKTSDFPQ